MLTEVCQYLRNWFEVAKYFGDFTIVNDTVCYSDGSQLPLRNGQYFRIVGSVFNDGVHTWGSCLEPEEFSGSVWSMSVPPVFIRLVEDIQDWSDKNTEVINSPYQSESFGGYSYTKSGGTSSSSSGEGGLSWQFQFASRLAPWRKI